MLSGRVSGEYEDTHMHFINMERPGDFKRVFTYDEVI
jgi:hypothetical protein